MEASCGIRSHRPLVVGCFALLVGIANHPPWTEEMSAAVKEKPDSPGLEEERRRWLVDCVWLTRSVNEMRNVGKEARAEACGEAGSSLAVQRESLCRVAR